ncbi:MAG: DUF6484 domain-containing protein [Planctomycetota bacterium]
MTRTEGVVIGRLAGLTEAGEALVEYPGSEDSGAVRARACVALDRHHLGRQVALMFEGCDPTKPFVVGLVTAALGPGPEANPPIVAERDGERLVLSAEDEVVLRCGKASITLTKAGKVLIKGKYVLSRSSGVNRVKGGSVQIN